MIHSEVEPTFILLFLIGALAGEQSFRLIGPDYPVVAVLGEDAVLPCHLSPPINAEEKEVRWFRTRFGSLVHLYDDGKDQNNRQLPEYQGRTELIRDHMSSGNVSLRIHNIRLKDEGRYMCYVRFDVDYQDKVLELKVAGIGSAPHISAVHCEDREVRVVCESTGWYPEPEVIWRGEDGQSLTPSFLTETQKQNSLFNIRTSLFLRINKKKSNFSCCVRNTLLNQERESTISISDSRDIGLISAIAASSSVGFCFVFALGVACCVQRKLKRTCLIKTDTLLPTHQNKARQGEVPFQIHRQEVTGTSHVTIYKVASCPLLWSGSPM
ncbi:butyrophilin subfamily 1 member A1 [Microcaecilia unicolor]|uniref:Butyrophilin subfamily 1 member A1-like n=1 Tax=Microcaecilia unicolor TaxID=1415580 RepID=A0A6P7XJ91_9AMPH|nr:butyrophilin subfamily 1 member A1-like [Microcaecilia unicolor]